MNHNENAYDQLLQINTTGTDDANADAYRYPYEPTPYCVLERFANSGLLGKNDVILDYGCGKGRVGFYLSYRTNAAVIGIEYDARIFRCALDNRKTGGFLHFVGNSHLFITVVIYFVDFGRRNIGDDICWRNDELLLRILTRKSH